MKSFEYGFPVGSHRQSTPDALHTVLAREASPGLIITGRSGVYTVTHRSSGYACTQYIGRLESAHDAALRLAALLDWDRPLDEISSDIQSRGEEFRRQLREAGRCDL